MLLIIVDTYTPTINKTEKPFSLQADEKIDMADKTYTK